MSDIIYEEKYEDILPCYDVGLFLNICFGCLFAIPFCIREYLKGQVDLVFVFTGFCGFISLLLVFYSMLYLSICKDYQKISLFFLMGMAAAFGLAWLLVKVFHRDIIYSMLLSLTIGFFLTAAISAATIKSYFKRNSRQYRKVLHYFKIYWHLIATNLLYTLGLYIHNFIFWTTDLKMTVAHTFVYAPAYDMATCLAMFTNLSSTIIFISRVEMHFHERYKAYSEAVIGGRWEDINNAKNRMFRQLASELMNLVRIQFIVSVVLYLLGRRPYAGGHVFSASDGESKCSGAPSFGRRSAVYHRTDRPDNGRRNRVVRHARRHHSCRAPHSRRLCRPPRY